VYGYHDLLSGYFSYDTRWYGGIVRCRMDQIMFFRELDSFPQAVSHEIISIVPDSINLHPIIQFFVRRKRFIKPGSKDAYLMPFFDQSFRQIVKKHLYSSDVWFE